MTCSERERDLALYASGDLFEPELEQHVAGCATCSKYVEDMRALLGELAGDAAPATPVIASVVLGRIRRRRYGWAAFAATAAAASVLIAVMVSMLSRPVETISVTLRAPAAPVVTLPVARGKAQPLRRPGKPAAPPAEPIVVKLVTDDPDVVIYWITD
jgi:hypothetical protein